MNRPVVAANTPTLFDTLPRFDGTTFDPALDGDRLRRQLGRVFEVMRDGAWRSLSEIAAATGDRSDASISARLRDLRKAKHGSHLVERRRRASSLGVWEYRIGTAEDAA